MNQVNLIGNLGGEVEIRTTAGGTVIGRMSIATKEKRKDRDGNWVDHTEWHRIVSFGKTAQNAAKFLTKGSQVALTGRLQTSRWKDKNDVDRYTTEIIVENLQYLDSKATTDNRRGKSGTGAGYSGNPQGGDTGYSGYGNGGDQGGFGGEHNSFGGDSDDDIPF